LSNHFGFLLCHKHAFVPHFYVNVSCWQPAHVKGARFRSADGFSNTSLAQFVGQKVQGKAAKLSTPGSVTGPSHPAPAAAKGSGVTRESSSPTPPSSQQQDQNSKKPTAPSWSASMGDWAGGQAADNVAGCDASAAAQLYKAMGRALSSRSTAALMDLLAAGGWMGGWWGGSS
jgi:hypothetical protein